MTDSFKDQVWRTLISIGAAAALIGTGAALNQINVNTGRLTRLEEKGSPAVQSLEARMIELGRQEDRTATLLQRHMEQTK